MNAPEICPLMFVNWVGHIIPSHHLTSAQASLLDNTSIMFLDYGDWPAWVLGTEREVNIWHLPNISHWDGVDEEGNPASGWSDTRLEATVDPGYIQRWPANEVHISLRDFKEAITTPFFIGPQKGWRPSTHAVVLQFAFERLNASADVQARAGYYRHLATTYGEATMHARYETAAAKVPQVASRLKPRPGDHFVAAVRHDDREIPCLVELGRSLNPLWDRGPRRFRARVYCADYIDTLAPGSTLYRRVCWREGDEEKACEADLGTVLICEPLVGGTM